MVSYTDSSGISLGILTIPVLGIPLRTERVSTVGHHLNSFYKQARSSIIFISLYASFLLWVAVVLPKLLDSFCLFPNEYPGEWLRCNEKAVNRTSMAVVDLRRLVKSLAVAVCVLSRCLICWPSFLKPSRDWRCSAVVACIAVSGTAIRGCVKMWKAQE